MEIHYEIIRSVRKSIAICIDHRGKIVVRAPLHVSEKQILHVVQSKTAWIEKKLQEADQKRKEIPRPRFERGDFFYFLGKKYPLEFVTVMNIPFTFDGSRFLLHPGFRQNALSLFIRFYQQEAEKYFKDKIRYFSSLLNVYPKRVKLSSATSRWGSCTAQKTILLNWRLILMPPDIIHYVIVHELAHLIYFNHRKDFWTLVASIIPDYKEKRLFLKTQAHRFLLPDGDP